MNMKNVAYRRSSLDGLISQWRKKNLNWIKELIPTSDI